MRDEFRFPVLNDIIRTV